MHLFTDLLIDIEREYLNELTGSVSLRRGGDFVIERAKTNTTIANQPTSTSASHPSDGFSDVREQKQLLQDLHSAGNWQP